MPIDAQAMVHGGEQVLRADRHGGGKGADAVGGAVDLAAADAAAGHHDAEAVGPVIAAAGGVEPRRPAKFAHHDHHRFVQKAALRQIFEKRSDGRIGRRKQFGPGPVEVIAMAVVALAAGAVVVPDPVDVHQSNAGFHQPACEENGLSENVPAIAIARAVRLSGDVEGTLGRLRRNQVECPRVIRIEHLGHRGLLQVAGLAVDLIEQGPPLIEARPADSGGRIEGTRIVAGPARIAVDAIGIEGGPEEAGVLSRPFRPDRRDRLGTITKEGTVPGERMNLASTEPGWGRSSRLMVTICGASRVIGLPTIIQYEAAGWLPVLCLMERMSENLSATRAMRGKCSLMDIPGARVTMGRNVPRISSGASGLRSNMSRWDGPPERNRRMTERALRRVVAAAARLSSVNKPGSDSPPKPSAPARRMSRRVNPSQWRTPWLASIFSMARTQSGL